jgi:ABC-type polysaccharide/polyol phosphate transport system ATPase subunit
VGDSAFQQKCFTRIEKFRRVGKTILFVSHNMIQVTDHCDRVVLIEKGSLLADGEPAQVVNFYKSLSMPELTTAQ